MCVQRLDTHTHTHTHKHTNTHQRDNYEQQCCVVPQHVHPQHLSRGMTISCTSQLCFILSLLSYHVQIFVVSIGYNLVPIAIFKGQFFMPVRVLRLPATGYLIMLQILTLMLKPQLYSLISSESCQGKA